MKFNFVKKNRESGEEQPFYADENNPVYDQANDVIAQPITIPKSAETPVEGENKGIKWFCVTIVSVFFICVAFLLYFSL